MKIILVHSNEQRFVIRHAYLIFIMTTEGVQIRSRAWYLVPILLGIIGGIIAYFLLRNDDPKKAKNCIWLSIILTVGVYVVPMVIISIRFS